MATVVNKCGRCGAVTEVSGMEECPQCESVQPAGNGLWRWSGVGAAIVVWGGSVALLLMAQVAALVVYFGGRMLAGGERPTMTLTPALVLFTLAGTAVAHALTLGVCWWVVTRGGKRGFFETLGWRWHTQFKWIHAGTLAIGMTGVAAACEKLLPHGETDFERLLMLSPAVRVGVAILAVATAPLVEEVVYRGILYTAFERIGRWRVGVAVVTLLFAFVHVPQYWGSWAAITAILLLSLVLTLLRAYTGQLLPCVATHFIFNAVQAVILLAVEQKPGAPVDAITGLLRQAVCVVV